LRLKSFIQVNFIQKHSLIPRPPPAAVAVAAATAAAVVVETAA